MSSPADFPDDPVVAAVAAGLAGRRVVLAVSGGRDSMALLCAAHRAARGAIAAVATFDHGTGPAATRAAGLVVATCAAFGLPCVAARAARPARGEAAWRAQRLGFLTRVAAAREAVLATAHTRDDQAETVAFRIVREAGVRGLAGLAAPSPVIRPLVDIPRAAVAAFAVRAGVTWVDDPSNADPRFARNRWRHELLPALERASPGLTDALVAIGAQAAAWRTAWAALITDRVRPAVRGAAVTVGAEALAALPAAAWPLAWAEIAARVGVVLDRRGTARLTAFTIQGRPGARIPLAGGHVVRRGRTHFDLRRGDAAPDFL